MVRAVGAPEALDGLVGSPTRFKEIVGAPGGVAAREVRAARTARSGSDERSRSHSRSGADAFGFVSNSTASHAASSQPWNTTANPMYRTDGARRRNPSSAR